MKIKLTTSQKPKVTHLINDVVALTEQLHTSKSILDAHARQLSEAKKHFKDVVEIIGEAHGIDVNKILNGEFKSTIDEKGNLVIEPIVKQTFSQQVKKQLNKKK
jgi:hypothetical protein